MTTPDSRDDLSKDISRLSRLRVHCNMFGYRGVEWSQTKGKYRARIWLAPRKGRWLGYHDTVESAALAYDEAARELHGAAARFGEVGVVRSRRDVGLCPQGHDQKLHGAILANGRPWCRICTSEAQKRSKMRRKARQAQS